MCHVIFDAQHSDGSHRVTAAHDGEPIVTGQAGRDACGPGTDLGCDNGATAILAETLDAGEYWVFVESSNFSTTGDFRLDVVTLPP